MELTIPLYFKKTTFFQIYDLRMNEKTNFFLSWQFPRTKKLDCKVQINLHGPIYQILMSICKEKGAIF